MGILNLVLSSFRGSRNQKPQGVERKFPRAAFAFSNQVDVGMARSALIRGTQNCSWLCRGRREIFDQAGAGRGQRTLLMKRLRLSLHLVPFFGNLSLSKISAFDVERYKKQRLLELAISGGVRLQPKNTTKLKTTSPGTINRELAVLSHLFNKVIERGWNDVRPAVIKRYQEGQSRITYLTIEQIKRLIEYAKQDQNAQIYPFIVIGLSMSMRCMEKGGSREQPITQQLVEFLEGHLAGLPTGTPWLFPSPTAEKGHTMDIRKPFRRVVSAAGMKPGRSGAAYASPYNHHTLGSGRSGFTYGKKNFGSQDPCDGGTICPPERRAYQDCDG